MNTKRQTVTAVLAAMLALSAAALADNDIDLPVNGDFRGSPAGYSPAPGWTLTADGGQARILPTTDCDDFALELQATPARSQSVVSDWYPVAGNTIKIELKLQGTGQASVGFEASDDSRNTLVASNRQTVTLSGYDQKIRPYFALPTQARHVRIRLTAEAGATARFRDVDADLVVMAAPSAGIVAAPAAPGAVAAPAVAPAAPAALPAAKLLQHERFYRFGSLAQNEYFETSMPVGSDIDFELGEDASAGRYWQVVSYNPAICRVKIEHDQDGIFPVRWDKAEIELKALGRGTTDVVFSCGGKKLTVRFTAL